MKSATRLTLFLIAVLVGSISAQTERTITKTVALEPNGRVFIDTYKGSLRIEAWDKPEVFLEARIEALDHDADDAREAMQLVDIEIDSRPDEFRVETSYERLNNKRDRWGFWDNWSTELPAVHYTLRIPVSASVVVDDYKSTSSVTGLSASLTFETYKGDLEVKDHSGEVRIETYKGDIRVAFRDRAHASTFETYKGDITVRLPEDAAFDVSMDLGRRADLRTAFTIETTGRHRNDDRRYEDSVNGGGPSMRFESTKGSIRLDTH